MNKIIFSTILILALASIYFGYRVLFQNPATSINMDGVEITQRNKSDIIDDSADIIKNKAESDSSYKEIILEGTLIKNKGEIVNCGNENDVYLKFENPINLNISQSKNPDEYIILSSKPDSIFNEISRNVGKKVTLKGHLEGGCGERGFMVVYSINTL